MVPGSGHYAGSLHEWLRKAGALTAPHGGRDATRGSKENPPGNCPECQASTTVPEQGPWDTRQAVHWERRQQRLGLFTHRPRTQAGCTMASDWVSTLIWGESASRWGAPG